MATELTEFVPVSRLPDHSRETNQSQPIGNEDLFLVSENDSDDSRFVSKKLTYDTLQKSLSAGLGIGQWVPKSWLMPDRWIYGNNIICSDVDWPQGPAYDKGNPMFLWALRQTLSSNIVSVMSHPLVSAMTDVFDAHEFGQICATSGYFHNLSATYGSFDTLSTRVLYVNGEDVKAFQFKGRGEWVSDTEISDITPTNPTYGTVVAAAGHQGWVYQVSKVGELSNLEYASNGAVWVQLGFDMQFASKTSYGIVKVGDGGLDVLDGILSTEDHVICSKKWYDDQVSAGTVDENTIYYLSDDNTGEISASPSTVGGVKLGYQDNANNFALRIGDDVRAYTQIPYATGLQAGVMVPGTGLSAGNAGSVSLAANGVTPGKYGLSADVLAGGGSSFAVPSLSVDGFGRVAAVSDSRVTLASDIIRWRGVIKCSTWSQVCEVLGGSNQKSNFIFSVSAAREGVAYSNIYSVSVSGKGIASLTKISGAGESSVKLRVYSDSSSGCFVEMFDGNSDSSASQAVQCALVKAGCGEVTVYESFTDGEDHAAEYGSSRILESTQSDIDAFQLSVQEVIGYAKLSDLSADEWNEAAAKISGLSTATSLSSGLVRIGYAENGKNYAVRLSDEQAYVTVPWTGGSASDVAVDDVTIGKKDEAGDYKIYVKSIASLSGDLTSTMAAKSDLSADEWNEAAAKTSAVAQLSTVQMRFYVDGASDPVTYRIVIA